jgi:hypothetical protein
MSGFKIIGRKEAPLRSLSSELLREHRTWFKAKGKPVLKPRY